MLVRLDTDDWKLGYCRDDPKYSASSLAWRASAGLKVYGLENDEGTIEAVICVGYTNDVPP